MELIAKELPNLDCFKGLLSNNDQKNDHLIDGFDNYRRFLFLIAKYPRTSAVPTKQIDAIWHSHLKNEDLYNQDCLNYFGRSIMHNPCDNIDDIPNLQQKFLFTKQLWQANFSSSYGEIAEMAFCGFDGDDGSDNGSEGGQR